MKNLTRKSCLQQKTLAGTCVPLRSTQAPYTGVRSSMVEYQKARLQYQLRKLAALQDGIYPAYGGNIEFELFSFFEICYHLKDWVKESTNSEHVESFVTNSPALRISADICNRLKHKRLRNGIKGPIVTHKRSKAPLGPFEISTETTLGPKPHMATVSVTKATILTERGKECCFELAKECLAEWESYFRMLSQAEEHS